MRTLAWLCGVAALLSGPAWAADQPEAAAQAVAEPWLKLIDDGQYEASWDQGSQLFKGSITKEDWKQVSTAARTALGKLVSRKLKSRQYTENIPGVPDGKYVVIQFETVFQNKASALETVTPTLEPDGAWRVAGYFVR